MRARDKMMNELLPARKCRSTPAECVPDYGEQTQIVRGAYHRRAKGLVVIESDTVGKKCCAPHYSSGLIPVEIIYVRASSAASNYTPFHPRSANPIEIHERDQNC